MAACTLGSTPGATARRECAPAAESRAGPRAGRDLGPADRPVCARAMDDAMERAAREEESARAWAAGRVEGDGSECAWRADVEKRPATRGHAIGGRDGQTRVTLPELRMEYGGKVWSMGSGQLAYTAELARAAAAARGSDTIVLMSTEWPEAEVLSSVSRALGMRGVRPHQLLSDGMTLNALGTLPLL